MTDVLLEHTDDGGEVTFVAGQPLTTEGLETAVYLSLFGGNERDSGLDDGDRLQFWGNFSEQDAVRRYRSETQHLVRSLPLTPSHLRRIEDAATSDVQWLVDEGFATGVAAEATMPALNTVKLDLSVEVDGETHSFVFTRTQGTT